MILIIRNGKWFPYGKGINYLAWEMFLLGRRIRQRNSWKNEVLLMTIEEDSIGLHGVSKSHVKKHGNSAITKHQ